MSDLLSWFSSYLSIAKITAVTVPGMVIAFALILVLGPIPCRDNTKDCPFCPATLKPVPVKDGGTTGRSGSDTSGGSSKKDDNSSDPVLPYLRHSTILLVDQGTPAAVANVVDGLDVCILNRTPPGSKAPDPKCSAAKAFAGGGKSARLNGYKKPAETKAADQANSDMEASCNSVPLSIPVTGAVAYFNSADMTADKKKLAAQGETDSPLSDQPQKGAVLAVNGELTILNGCSNQVQDIESKLGVKKATLAQLAAQDVTDLTSLSSNLIPAQQQGEALVQADIQKAIGAKKADLAYQQQEQAKLANVQSAVDALQKTVTTMLAALTAPPAAAAAKDNTAIDVFQTIEQNLIKFLLFSLILGQILDPIQRGAISFIGPRRNLFIAYNRVYGQFGDGEFRYGDRRLEPWVMDGEAEVLNSQAEGLRKEASFKVVDPQGNVKGETKRQLVAELRSNAAGAAFAGDQNIYDKNYAVGAGFITKAEAAAIDDEYYSQSQITSGLILPMLILSACLAIRFICCSATVPAADHVATNVTIAMASITFGAALGMVLILLALLFGSRRYSKVALAFLKEATKGIGDNIYRFVSFLVLAIGAALLWIFGWHYQNDPLVSLDLHSPYLIMLPAMLMGPLWIFGIDRLHKYYSELEARIAGNILRLQSNTEQKMVDLINDPASAGKLKTKLDDAMANHKRVTDFLAAIAGKSKGGSSSTPPAPPAAGTGTTGTGATGTGTTGAGTTGS
jgi:hypothetical protein